MVTEISFFRVKRSIQNSVKPSEIAVADTNIRLPLAMGYFLGLVLGNVPEHGICVPIIDRKWNLQSLANTDLTYSEIYKTLRYTLS